MEYGRIKAVFNNENERIVLIEHGREKCLGCFHVVCKDEISDLNIGDLIDFEVESFFSNGKIPKAICLNVSAKR